GALGDIGDAMTAQVLALFAGHSAHVLAPEDDLAAGDEAAGARIAHGGEADGGLARPALADQTQDLALAQLQADIVPQHRAGPGIGADLDPQVLDIENVIAERSVSGCGFAHAAP